MSRFNFKNHPGTVPLIGVVLLGGVAGGLTGMLIMAAIFGSIYLFGAYGRKP